MFGYFLMILMTERIPSLFLELIRGREVFKGLLTFNSKDGWSSTADIVAPFEESDRKIQSIVRDKTSTTKKEIPSHELNIRITMASGAAFSKELGGYEQEEVTIRPQFGRK